MKKEGLLCWNCRKIVPYTVCYRKKVRAIDGNQYAYQEKFGVCDICHEEIAVPGIADENERMLDAIYRSENDLITVDEIKEILDRYHIEKRPLSHVLGMGEHTISRYLEGALPSRRYSDFLRNILRYHGLMREYLEKNKKCVTDAAYQKADAAVAQIEKMSSYDSKTELLALYIIHSAYEVTDLSLQKMLYYVKAFSWIFLKRDIIEDGCEAWAYGPVFPGIYEKYKSLGNATIMDYDSTIDYDALLSSDEKLVADFVVEYFGIYNGNILMTLTHKERPWIEARSGLPEFVASNNPIKEETIHAYFDEMDNKYSLKTGDGVNRYIWELRGSRWNTKVGIGEMP